ncbi:hypothetical protein HGRIS_013350 [Hohenbuehelia grisea]|uniref:Uncharacterized protein n=1 Tax=Hohenbuehelia grisea TaxID=104357 RepID=A0ABR3IVF2_9AGAR
MGNAQSSSPVDEKTFQPETAIQFSEELVDKLAVHAASPKLPVERQSSLDLHIRSRITSELERLRTEEEDVRVAIQHALEKENLDREAPSDSGDASAGHNSLVLLGDIEQIQQQVDRFSHRGPEGYESLKQHADNVLACYSQNGSTPLKCWREAQRFKDSVAKLEQTYIKSFQ